MRLIDADALMSNLMIEDFKEHKFCYPCKEIMEAIKEQPTIEERKTGKWEERKVSIEKVIDEWQSARCSVCGRYDTRPYLYYFDEPRFCSWCGARMER